MIRTSQGKSYPDDGPVGRVGVSCSDQDHLSSVFAAPSWRELGQVWSPRQYVRVDPERCHDFSAVHRLADDAPAPGVPFALHLTDEQGDYRLLALDFDAHTAGSTAEGDVADCSSRLAAAGVSHLVCSSGPSGGFHLWIRLTAGVTQSRLDRLVEVLAAVYPSLDTAPLRNARTGCVRAPGAAHRGGGASRPLGDTSITPVSFTALQRLIPKFEERHAAHSTQQPTPSAPPVTALTDLDGAPYLEGPRRPLSPQLRGLTHRTIEVDEDASSVGWSILLACAHARMRRHDLVHAAFTAHWPGLEFLRTHRTGPGTREPRLDRDTHLARQWAKAVTAAAYTPRATSDRKTDARLEAQQLVADTLTTLNTHPARWTGKTGAQDRLILLALCARTLSAATTTVHLAERSWALAAGLARDVVSDRLPRLRKEGWITQARRAAGPWAATWTLTIPGGGETRSGAVFTPQMEQQLTTELEYARADIWHAPALGVLGLQVWHQLRAGRATVAEVATVVGVCAATVRTKLRALRSVGLLTGSGRCYWGQARLKTAAQRAGVTGAHADRVRIYRLQSAVFVWWFTTRYHPDNSDAIAEWGEFPTPRKAVETDPQQIALAYGPDTHGRPVEATSWGAAMATLDHHHHLDPDSWWELVTTTRAALPGPDLLTPGYRVATASAA